MTDQQTRKRLAKLGFIHDGKNYYHETDPMKIIDYLNSSMLRTPLPKQRKRLKLSEY